LAREHIGQIITKNFDLRHTFESANPLTFFGEYDHKSNTLAYPSGNSLIKVQFIGNCNKGKLLINGSDSRMKKKVIARLRLNDDMEKIYGAIATDHFMKHAIEKYRGMHVTLNDPWETTVCFIISQYNNVKRIRKITRSIVDRFGLDITNEDGKVIARSFPNTADLAEATIKEFMECGAGFRAKYLKEAVEYCSDSVDLRKIGKLDYPSLKEELMEIKGVGEKVADCIALMGYGKLEAFPIDVWVKRTMERVYFKGKDIKIKDLRNFANERFGDYCGYAQQYLFWHGRNVA
jgi:N-glycosylase/DNA lyase